MNAVRADRECLRFDRWLTAYVDDELDAVHCLELEDHLASCDCCSETIATLHATRQSLRKECKVVAPAALRERICRKVAQECAFEEQGSEESDETSVDDEAPPSGFETGGAVQPSRAGAHRAGPQLVKLRYVVPVAAAATFALVFGAMRLQEAEVSEGGPQVASASTTEAMVGQRSALDGLLEDLVAQHVHPPPPETTDPAGLRRFDPYIGVRVRKPTFDQLETQYVGARMHQRAALLQYILRNRHRVTVYVFDSNRVPVSDCKLERRNIGKNHVFVGNIRGYSVAAAEQSGVGYALASDVTGEEAAKLLLMAQR